jgi:hypothetical protein
VIPEAVAMEATAMETRPANPVVVATGGTTPGLGTIVAPEVRVETQVDPLPEANMDVVIREPIIEEAAPTCSTPMSEATSTRRGGLELLDDNLIDPTVITRSMESRRRTEQWIKVRCEYRE